MDRFSEKVFVPLKKNLPKLFNLDFLFDRIISFKCWKDEKKTNCELWFHNVIHVSTYQLLMLYSAHLLKVLVLSKNYCSKMPVCIDRANKQHYKFYLMTKGVHNWSLPWYQCEKNHCKIYKNHKITHVTVISCNDKQNLRY